MRQGTELCTHSRADTRPGVEETCWPGMDGQGSLIKA